MFKARSYRAQLVVLGLVALGAAILTGFLGSHVLRAKEAMGSPWLVLVLLLGLIGLAFMVGMPWWRKLDDMQRAGQLNAWYWGGQAGGLAVLMALIAFTGKSDFARGALALLAGEVIGFALFWLIWRWRSGGPAE